MSGGQRWPMRGVIASAGFASGHRFVIGRWDDSPLGAMADVMWAAPDGTRTLLAPHQSAADFITAVYAFDRVEVVPVQAAGDTRWIEVKAGPLEIQLRGGPGFRIPVPRPPWFTRFVEAPVARLAMGVRTYGTSDRGVHEWYRADAHRPVVAGWATIDGVDQGALGPVRPPCRFGFSEPPARPSIVAVRPLLHDPSGRLDEVVLAAARELVQPA